MTDPVPLTDRLALNRHRARALSMADPALFLHEQAADDVQERLDFVNRRFTDAAVVTPFPQVWTPRLADARMVPDDETLDLPVAAHDLVVHGMALHWANDPIGQLIQCRRALRPDGFFLATFLGGETLSDLRTCLAEAEASVTGGLSPRVAPMADLRSAGALLQRAGFSLPVADSTTTTVSYDTPFHLMRDLRAMGETNALAARHKAPARRAVFAEATKLYTDRHCDSDGRVIARFETIVLTGWAPDDSQPKPLRPGSATTRLADALSTDERPLRDDAAPGD
ncbi:methyltransferase domain-containing protein [Anianabacter salinae]|uniref:methyltransferase domain-containing protein n=1 Tax=Anianabacter salinae TaxID=2851023 RepID=UPI00225E6631|nr:methyltransferase domain-containing protein [Anianabacter salinae]MBV0913549.1 class I SAM-dependent methyltransferase [Anianabacter salinae]